MKPTTCLFFVFLITTIISCSDKEDEGPDLNTVTLSISGINETMTLPTAMTTNSDYYAYMAKGWIDFAKNVIHQNLDMLAQPSPAASSSVGITPVNGNPSPVNSYVLYIGTSYVGSAYRITDTGTKYVFESLEKDFTKDVWYRDVAAEETKDQKSGNMFVYGNSDFGVLDTWTWNRNGDDFTLSLDSHMNYNGAFKIDYKINTKTHAGQEIYFEGTEKKYEFTWDHRGAGTWKVFENGTLSDSGTW